VKRVLVANRGEIAVRVIRAVRELGLEAVAVYTDPDADALHVRKADAALAIGPRAAYLDIDALVAAARESGADSVHPGYGFLAENPRFAAACEEAGLTFVGPPADAIERMGDKAAARRLAARTGVPVVPGTEDVASLDEALATARDVGYPVMVKAAAGGGGRGIRTARDPDELRSVAETAAREAKAAFGDESLYLEKLLLEPRHVEVQVCADGHGNVVHVFERECSLQRRRQKVLEEAPAPRLDGDLRAAITGAAVRLAREVGYENAGTVEFLVDRDGAFYFIEMNTRIQVEHTVTEMVTGIDLVKEQLRVAAGERLSFAQEDVVLVGAAIEFRINAEDPDAGFRPSPGTVSSFETPGGPGVRLDTALYEGYRVSPFYDSLVAKLIVWDRGREEAIERGRRALDELVIDGIRTTIPFHLRVLDHPVFRAGEIHTGFLDDGPV
jgi:acetyl-CoA carboxylase biotin carboxylase subunit